MEIIVASQNKIKLSIYNNVVMQLVQSIIEDLDQSRYYILNSMPMYAFPYFAQNGID